MCTRQTAFVSLSSAPTLTNIPPLSKHRFCWFVQRVKCLEVTNIKRPPILNLVMIIMYFKLWHTLIEALNAHIIYINQSTIFYTHVEQSLTKAIHTQHARVKGNDRGDRLLGKAALTSGFLLGRSEVLRSLRHYLRAQSQRHNIDRLEERGVERGSARRSSLKGRERAIVSQTNTGIVSKATLGKLLRETEWSASGLFRANRHHLHLNWTELNWTHNSNRNSNKKNKKIIFSVCRIIHSHCLLHFDSHSKNIHWRLHVSYLWMKLERHSVQLIIFTMQILPTMQINNNNSCIVLFVCLHAVSYTHLTLPTRSTV